MRGFEPIRIQIVLFTAMMLALDSGCTAFSLNDTALDTTIAEERPRASDLELNELFNDNLKYGQPPQPSSYDVWESTQDLEQEENVKPATIDLKTFLRDKDQDIPLKEAFENNLPPYIQIDVFPVDTKVRFSGRIQYDTIDNLMLKLERRYDLLIVRLSDTIYEVYCPEYPKTHEINYIYTCVETRASDLIYLLATGTRLGLPRANALVGDGRGNFNPHLVPTLVPAEQMPDPKRTGPPPVAGDLPVAAPATKRDIRFELATGNGILISGTQEAIRKAVNKLRVLDRPTKVILIEVLIVQYFHDEQFTWRYNLTDGALLKGDPPEFNENPDLKFGQPIPIGGGDRFGPQPWGIDFQNVSIDPTSGGLGLAYSGIGTLTQQFKQNVTLLASENMARVVTNPHIAVINGHTGQVLLNEKFNFVNSVVTPTGTITEIADSLDSQTSISVTPTILGPNRVHVAVNTSLATFDNVTVVQSALPGQRINELGTSVILDNNKSLILGGLVKEEAGEIRDKIPGLAKIPLLGHLFRGKNEIRRFSETVVYIIPHMNKADTQGIEDEYRAKIFQEMCELQALGEEVREKNRWDKNESNRLYNEKELQDHAAHHATQQDIKRTRKEFKQAWHCPIHTGPCDCLPPQLEESLPALIQEKHSPDEPTKDQQALDEQSQDDS